MTIGEMKSKREVQNRGVEWNLSWLEALKLIQHKKRKGRRGNETRGELPNHSTEPLPAINQSRKEKAHSEERTGG